MLERAKPFPDMKAYTVDQFCVAFNIGRSTYYDLDAHGLGPTYIKVGRRRLILEADADDWAKTHARESVVA